MNDCLSKSLAHWESQKDSFSNVLMEAVKIPSISFPGYPADEVLRAAEWHKERLRAIQGGTVRLLECGNAPPCVLGKWHASDSLPTVLLYAHYDVQPPMREELWASPAFAPCTKEGRVYGRGAADDKAGVIAIEGAIASLSASGISLPVNLTVLWEGEEEVGSPHMGEILTRYRKELDCDAMVILDGSNFDTGIPALTTSLRGLVSLTVSVRCMDHPLHSGLWGGPIPDPVMALCKMLSGLTDEDGDIRLPGWKKGCLQPLPEEDPVRMPIEVFRDQAGILPGVELTSDEKNLLQRLWQEPSLVINAIQAGEKKTAGNVIMESAWARVGIRTTMGMDAKDVRRALAESLRASCPWGLKLEIEEEDAALPWKGDVGHPLYPVARAALGEAYGREAVLAGCGASIPLVSLFEKAFGPIPILLWGILDPSSNAHSENESQSIADFHSTTAGLIRFLFTCKDALAG